MVKGRMLEIVRYLEKERMASYKEIAGVLEMKERTVRYDVDCINNELSLKKAPLIEKYPKGMFRLLLKTKNLYLLLRREVISYGCGFCFGQSN